MYIINTFVYERSSSNSTMNKYLLAFWWMVE